MKKVWKVNLARLSFAMKQLSSKDIEVLLYILQNVMAENNVFIGTIAKITRGTGLNERTVTRAMKKFKERNFLKKIQNGVYQINTEIFR